MSSASRLPADIHLVRQGVHTRLFEAHEHWLGCSTTDSDGHTFDHAAMSIAMPQLSDKDGAARMAT